MVYNGFVQPVAVPPMVHPQVARWAACSSEGVATKWYIYDGFALAIAVPPVVQPKPRDGRFVVRKGSTISLECSARGNPAPTITWTRTVP